MAKEGPLRGTLFPEVAHISGNEGSRTLPSYLEAVLCQALRASATRKCREVQWGVTRKAGVELCFPLIGHYRVTKRGPEGRLGGFRTGTCQASATTVAKRCPEMLTSASLRASICAPSIAVVAKICPEEHPGHPEGRFFPCSGHNGWQETLVCTYQEQRSVGNHPVFPVNATTAHTHATPRP